jgi:hypothetical protein
MNGCQRFRALVPVVVIVASTWLSTRECHADISIADIVANDKGIYTTGALTFTFTDKSVSSDEFGDNFTPTAANILVSNVPGGVTFTLSQMATLRGQAAKTDKFTITYSVAVTNSISSAGLSFGGFAKGDAASSSATETFPDGHNEMLNVFTTGTDDDPKNNNNQNNQMVPFPDLPMTLKVMDVGQLSIPDRGGDASSDTQISSITNTFSVVPEPSSFVMVSIAMLVGVGVWWRARKRVAA